MIESSHDARTFILRARSKLKGMRETPPVPTTCSHARGRFAVRIRLGESVSARSQRGKIVGVCADTQTEAFILTLAGT